MHLDSQLRVLAANEAFCEKFLADPAEASGSLFPRFFHPARRHHLCEHFAELLAGNQSNFSVPLPLVDAGGETVDCLVTCMTVGLTPPRTYEDCIAIAVIRADVPYGTPAVLLPVPPALAEVPARVLEGLAAGFSTHQLATRLGLSSHGVEYHVSSMLRKLKAPNRSALVARAYALGILTPGAWPPIVNPRYASPKF